jgi:hypothetical protein
MEAAVEEELGFRFQVSGFRFQVSGFRFQVSGFRLQVSGFRLQVRSFPPTDIFVFSGGSTSPMQCEHPIPRPKTEHRRPNLTLIRFELSH